MYTIVTLIYTMSCCRRSLTSGSVRIFLQPYFGPYIFSFFLVYFFRSVYFCIFFSVHIFYRRIGATCFQFGPCGPIPLTRCWCTPPTTRGRRATSATRRTPPPWRTRRTRVRPTPPTQRRSPATRRGAGAPAGRPPPQICRRTPLWARSICPKMSCRGHSLGGEGVYARDLLRGTIKTIY